MTKDRQAAKRVWILPGLTALFLCLLFLLNGIEAGKAVPIGPSAGTVNGTAMDSGPSGTPSGGSSTASGTPSGVSMDGGASGTSPGGSAVPADGTASGGRLDLNAASVEELQTLPGIGPVLAERIGAYRTEHGPFPTVEAVMEVSGIGEKTFAAMEPYIYVSVDSGP